jgi:hypothetical protein
MRAPLRSRRTRRRGARRHACCCGASTSFQVVGGSRSLAEDTPTRDARTHRPPLRGAPSLLPRPPDAQRPPWRGDVGASGGSAGCAPRRGAERASRDAVSAGLPPRRRRPLRAPRRSAARLTRLRARPPLCRAARAAAAAVARVGGHARRHGRPRAACGWRCARRGSMGHSRQKRGRGRPERPAAERCPQLHAPCCAPFYLLRAAPDARTRRRCRCAGLPAALRPSPTRCGARAPRAAAARGAVRPAQPCRKTLLARSRGVARAHTRAARAPPRAAHAAAPPRPAGWPAPARRCRCAPRPARPAPSPLGARSRAAAPRSRRPPAPPSPPRSPPRSAPPRPPQPQSP